MWEALHRLSLDLSAIPMSEIAAPTLLVTDKLPKLMEPWIPLDQLHWVFFPSITICIHTVSQSRSADLGSGPPRPCNLVQHDPKGRTDPRSAILR